MSHSDAAQCAVHLRRAVSQLARRLRPNLRHAGLSAAKLSVVGQLYRAGPMTPTALAAYEGIKIQSLTRLLAELEADGWLVRTTDACDGRKSLMSLTQAGTRRLIDAVQEGDASLTRIIATTLSEDERALLRQACSLLERIGDTVGELAPAQTDPASGPGQGE